MPTIVVTVVMGNDSILLLIVSQVVISLTLSFATFPLLYFTSQERIMGKVLVNSWSTMIVGMVVVSVIAGFNLYLARDVCLGFFLIACLVVGVSEFIDFNHISG